MVFGTVPRTLSPGDEAVIPVSVNSYKEGRRTVKVTLTAGGAALMEAGSKDVVFEKTGEQIVEFRVKAPALPGNARIGIRAESAGLKTATHTTELEIRSTAIPVSKSAMSLVSPGESWRGRIAYPGREGSNGALVEFSRLPPVNLESRLGYLIAYPHGCVEQTTSSVFPQLYLDKTLSLNDARIAEIRSNIAAGIERLGGFQAPGGGFSYWPGGGQAHDWGTSYAGHFLLEAKRAGYAVPSNLMNQWVKYQKERAGFWQARGGNRNEQAYRLYTLALAGEADLGSMNRLRDQRDIGVQAAWRLAAAYWYAGQRDTARSMALSLETKIADYRELSETFGSTLRDKAMILETLVLLDDTVRVKPLLEEISAALSTDSWLSTQETAYALIAVVSYMRGSSAAGIVNMEANIAGRSRSAAFPVQIHQLDMGSLSGLSGDYTVTNKSAVPVYARVIVKGLPEEGSEQAMAEGLSLKVEYRDARSGRAIDPRSLSAGEDMDVIVTAGNSTRGKISEIALVHPIPASWEIVNFRLGGDSDGSASPYKYQDIRDDRVMTYFDLERGSSKTVSFRVNRAYAGNYYRPAIHAYAMYDETIRALVPGEKPGN
jgi:uncharacterized protein YfaS (alpha-2-macroglobulin family)